MTSYFYFTFRYRILDEYPSEPYTDVYWVKFVDIDAARVAKRKLDNRSFFGKNLHISYAPEFESVDETRKKLQQRRATIIKKTKGATRHTFFLSFSLSLFLSLSLSFSLIFSLAFSLAGWTKT